MRDAIRDEGTSYHYLPADELVESDPEVAASLSTELEPLGLPLFSGRVWTTMPLS